MNMFRTIFAGCLFLLLNVAVVAYGQEDKNDSAKPAQQDEATPGTAKPQQEPMPAQEEKRTQQERNKQGQDREKPAQEQKNQQNDETRNAQNAQGKERNEQNRASVPGDQHKGKQASQRIPEEKFRASFGREHHFRVSQPVIVQGRPRIQYSGYWFEFVDTWPVGWSYSDDCYIDYIDGQYFLINVLHPEVRLALIVVSS
jgi:hypothetical protein